ncbi:hypothetical protein D3C75_1125600 [compost metagenome]
MEQVVAPAAILQRQFAGFGIVGAEGVQAQQLVHAALLAGAQVTAQALDGGGQALLIGGDQAPTGGGIQQQFGDQPRTGLAACGALRLVVGDQSLQALACRLEQQGQALVQAPLAVLGRRHAVEAHQRV